VSTHRFDFIDQQKYMQIPDEAIIKRPCAFVMRLNSPLHTQVEILKFFIDRAISVSSMNLQSIHDREGILILHCVIERDRIRRTVRLLEKIKGIIEMELLESKGTNMVKDYDDPENHKE
jgi:hypothetical protein